MAESIIQRDMSCCYICGSTQNLEEHHCIHGTANRKLAEKYKLKVRLCWCHHRSNKGAHHDRELDLFLIRTAQQCFEEQIGDREMFRNEFGKSWL